MVRKKEEGKGSKSHQIRLRTEKTNKQIEGGKQMERWIEGET
jgi:hypothetical protein